MPTRIVLKETGRPHRRESHSPAPTGNGSYRTNSAVRGGPTHSGDQYSRYHDVSGLPSREQRGRAREMKKGFFDDDALSTTMEQDGREKVRGALAPVSETFDGEVDGRIGAQKSRTIPDGGSLSRIGSPTKLSSRRMTGYTRASSRRVVGFQSSILRELKPHSDRDDNDEDEAEASRYRNKAHPRGRNDGRNEVGLSTDDIRASPRLLGYLFSLISSLVMLVSVIQFYREGEIDANIDSGYIDGGNQTLPGNGTFATVVNDPFLFSDIAGVEGEEFFISTTGSQVYRWKLWGAIYFASVNVGVCLLTLLAHFDTVCMPQLWMVVFRDGSNAERNWIIFLILFGIASVHIATSSLSVGESQANVYFTTWISFGSFALNYGVWRESAGLPSLEDKIFHQSRETTYNWIWTAIFSSVFAGALTDMYFNRDEIELRSRGQDLDLDHKDWIHILALVWAEAGVCFLAVLFNEYFTGLCVSSSGSAQKRQEQYGTGRDFGFQEQDQGLNNRSRNSVTAETKRMSCIGISCAFGWRQLEGLIIVLAMGFKFWIVLEYTGIDGVINGLSNSYFGVWGSFFNSVFCLGTWLRENTNFEYIIRERDTENNSSGDQVAIEATAE